jgi:methionine synthase II (cobalamin-independent)
MSAGTLATGIGSMPGDDVATSLQVVLDELVGDGAEHGLPYLPELPARGVGSAMVGRTLSLVSGIGVDLQPAGWRLTDAPGVDHRRARSRLDQDLDVLEEHVQGYPGAFKVQVAGPWTLAATVEKPRGDKVLSDHGARRELAQALAEGVRDHVRDVRRRLGDRGEAGRADAAGGVPRLVVQVDEPALAAVLGGGVPTASGFGRHRTVHPPEASEQLGWVLAAIAEEGAEPWVHACAAGTPLDLLRGAGARGLAVDVGVLDAAAHDVLATALEAGERVVLGLVAATDDAGLVGLTDTAVVERALRWLDMVGLDPATVADRLAVSPACGLAGASADGARRALRLARSAAAHLG